MRVWLRRAAPGAGAHSRQAGTTFAPEPMKEVGRCVHQPEGRRQATTNADNRPYVVRNVTVPVAPRTRAESTDTVRVANAAAGRVGSLLGFADRT